MSTVNKPQSDSSATTQLQTMLEQMKNIGNGTPAYNIAQLTHMIEEILERLNPQTPNSKIVHPDFAPAPPLKTVSNHAPSNAQMQESIGQLMELLAQLEGEIAKYASKKAQANASLGQSLMSEMGAQVKRANEELQNVLQDQNHSDFWSKFIKVAEIVAAVVFCAVALLLGQPELFAIILVFTVLSQSGAMDKITQGLADVISQILVAAGVPKATADTVAKVLADVIIIAASIIITVATCGAGAGAVVDELAEDGIEMTDMTLNSTDETVTTAEDIAPKVESYGQKLQNTLSKAGNAIKENNPFNKVSKTTNLGIVAGTQAAGSANFSADLTSAILLRMPEGKAKDLAKEILQTILSLLTLIAGAGAGASACAGPAAYQLKNVAAAVKVFTGLQIAASVGQATGETGQGVTYTNLAVNTNDQGITQALLSILQGLINMNTKQSNADTKALSAKMKTWATEISTLGTNLNLAGAAVARELQA
jgi:hypothetical protein